MPVFTTITNFVTGLVTSAKMNTVKTAIGELQDAWPAGVIKTSSTTGTTTTNASGAQSSAIAVWNVESLTLGSPRRVYLVVDLVMQASVADTKMSVTVSVDGTQRLRWATVVALANTTEEPTVACVPFDLAAGAHSFTATVAKATTTAATVNIANGSLLRVVDLGAA